MAPIPPSQTLPTAPTALHHIAEAFFSSSVPNYSKYFRLLLARGVDVNTSNSLGEIALFRFVAMLPPASQRGEQVSCMNIPPLFEEAGANLKVRDKKGEGLLHRLAGTGLYQEWQEDVQKTWLVIAAAAENEADKRRKVLDITSTKTAKAPT